MKKINNVSDVFREVKKYLWDGKSGWEERRRGNEFICHAIDDVTDHASVSSELRSQARKIIQHRLGENRGGARTVTDYLHDVLELQYEELTSEKVQKYRKDWLTSLEKEFAPKSKPKKGFYIHHFDGDRTNNELSNLTYVPVVTKSYI
jgi:hypothetical protein